MPDVAQGARRRVLNSLEGIQSVVLTARNSTKIPTDYQTFELVLTILSGCRHSIERTQDQEQIIEILLNTSDRLRLWQSGITETVVRSARVAINETVADLERKKRDL